MAQSIRNQHLSAIDEVKSTLDQTNPINRVINEVDDPTEESEMLLYWLNKNNIPCMLQKVYVPVDVSKIEQMKADKELKKEAIAYKSEKAAQKIIWINRKAYGEVTGLNKKLIDFLNDKHKGQQLTISNKCASINPTEKTVGFIRQQNCGLITFSNPTEKSVGFEMTINVELNGNDTTFFPSTLLPEIFKKYDHKSDVNKALSEYYRATSDFTKRVLDIIETNFFIYMCEVQYTRSQCKIEQLLTEMKSNNKEARREHKEAMENSERKHQEVMAHLTRRHDRVVVNEKDPRVIAIYRHKTWPKHHIKMFAGLKTDKTYKKITNDDEYVIIKETKNINNTSKIKKDIVSEYEKGGKLQKNTLVDSKKKRHKTLKMSDETLKQFIRDLSTIDIDYLTTMADSSSGSDEEDDTPNETLTTNWLIIARDKKKSDGTYGLYIALSDSKYINEDDECLYIQKEVYNDNVIDKIKETFLLDGEFIVDDDDGLNWFHSSIKSKKDFTQICSSYL